MNVSEHRGLPERLRELRASRKLSQNRLAAAIGVSKTLVAQFESGRAIPQEGTAQRIDELFGTGTEIQEASTKAQEDRRPWLRSWLDHERAARTLRAWEPTLIPGPLQCESYMRAIFAAAPDNAGRVDELTADRLARQAGTIGREEHPTIVSAVLGEAALTTGPPDVLKDQLDHLINLGHRPNVKIRIVPRNAGGLHVGLAGAFVIAQMPDGRRVGYADNQLTGEVVTANDGLMRLEVTWLEVDALALSAEQSRDLILRMINDYK